MQQNSDAADSRNILITIKYDGKDYHGWQIQENAVTVQEVFQNALKKLFRHDLDIKGCSRTDTGVHANMYCLSLTLYKSEINKVFSKGEQDSGAKKGNKIFEIPCQNLLFALNGLLPKNIAVIGCRDVPLDFHARYSCLGKEYIYKILNTQIRDPFWESYALHYRHFIDIEKVTQAAKFYVGTHDFTSFCNINTDLRGNMVRTVKKFEISRKDSIIEMRVEADGFLYNMVRIMVGTLISVCQGRIAPLDIPYILEKRDRSKAGKTAPPWGLYLNKVFYGFDKKEI